MKITYQNVCLSPMRHCLHQVGAKSKRQCYRDPHVVQEVPLHGLQVTVWCAASAHKIIKPIFSKETGSFNFYIQLILTPFFRELTENVELLHTGKYHG
jgi:hypothetical protein